MNYKLFCSDIDFTLTDHILSERDTKSAFDFDKIKNLKHTIFSYATGRPLNSVLKYIKKGVLLKPEYIICEVGTKIYNFKKHDIELNYHDNIKRDFDANYIKEILTPYLNNDTLTYQKSENITDLKVSYYLNENINSSLLLNEFEKILSDNNIQAQIIFSSGKDIDFIPKTADKGRAVKYLAQKHNINENKVLVAGDSGNDISLFKYGFNGIIVANAKPELLSIKLNNTYYSSGKYFMGVTEGIDHFNF